MSRTSPDVSAASSQALAAARTSGPDGRAGSRSRPWRYAATDFTATAEPVAACNAAYLAHVFPHVYVDVGLALNHVGARAGAVLAETLELAPFAKILFSTDAYGLPELYVVGAALFREHLQRVLAGWVADDACTAADADRFARMLAADNARQLYRLAC